LKDEAGGGGYRRSRLRSGLVVAQIVLSLVILVAAGLLVRSLQRAQVLGPGFVTERAVALSLDLDLQGYDTPRGQEFQRRLLERVTTLPGVQAAGLTGYLPLSLNYSSSPAGLRADCSQLARRSLAGLLASGAAGDKG
jgi:putative ABC transport system permease protein